MIIFDKKENPTNRNIDLRLAFGWIFIALYLI